MFYIVENKTENKSDRENKNNNEKENEDENTKRMKELATEIGIEEKNVHSTDASVFEEVNNLIHRIVSEYLTLVEVIVDKPEVKQQQQKQQVNNQNNKDSKPKKPNDILFPTTAL